MAFRIITFLLLLPVFGWSQTTDVKDIQVARQKLQIGTDAADYLNEITQTISVASTHVQSPTAKAVYDYLTGFLTAVNLSFTGTSSPVTLANSGGTDVTFTAGTGISFSASSGNITITNTATDQTVTITGSTGIAISGTYPNFTLSVSDQSATNEAQTLSVSGTSTGIISLNAISGVGGGTATIAGGGINTVSQLGGTITVTGAEVDGAAANEGVLGVGAGSGTSSVLLSNTAGATGVTFNAGTGITISETTSANGGQITITNSSSGITGTLTAPRVPFASGASALTDDANLSWDNTNKRLLIGSGTSAAFLNVFAGSLSGTHEFFRASANISGNMMTQTLNANAINSAANTINVKSTGGANAGDPYDQYVISGVRTWSAGVDNSAADAYKISTDATLGASTASDVFIIETDGRASIGGAATVANVNLTVAGTGGIILPSGNGGARPGATEEIIRNNTDFNGLEFKNSNTQWHRITGTSFPGQVTASVAGAGAGVSPVFTTTGTDRAFRLNLTTGTAPTANGDIIAINYGQSFGIQPYITFSAYNAQAATDITKFYISTSGNGSFTLKANGTLAASTAYILSFIVQQ